MVKQMGLRTTVGELGHGEQSTYATSAFEAAAEVETARVSDRQTRSRLARVELALLHDERSVVKVARFVGRLPGAPTPDEVRGHSPAAQGIVSELHAPLVRDADLDQPIFVIVGILLLAIA